MPSEHAYSDVEREHNWATMAKNYERRERVLAFPDLAAYLTHPPLSLPDPQLWSGFIPPATWREQANNSPVRAQLVAICKMVAERERVVANRGLSEGPDTGEVAPELITDAQLTKLHTALSEYGITDRADKHLYLQAETGHPIASSKDLTKAEASLIIDRLDQLISVETAKREAQHATQDQGKPDTGGSAQSGAEPDPWAYRPGRQPWTEPKGGSGADFDPYARGDDPPY